MKKIIHIILVLAAVGVAFWLGFALRTPDTAPVSTGEATAAATIWTCSMHPQVRQNGEGLCPLCGMDLIPAEDTGESLGPWQLRMTDQARKLASIETASVRRQHVAREIRMVGKVEYDEKLLGVISAWVGGRIERLYVDFTGVTVTKDDHLADIYSPKLLTAQQELLAATNSFRNPTYSGQQRQSILKRVMAVREKLRLYGLSPKQIAEIERRGAATEELTIYSDLGGVVIEKHAVVGQYVKEGDPIYTIADLSQVWVKLDAYEDDLIWLKYGQEVSFETHAYPGEDFSGTVVFIDPVLNPETRTVKVRLNVNNESGKLKPDMFVRAIVFARLGGEGGIVQKDLKGKWISPMHPEVVKDGPGQCDVCGMDLVPAEKLFDTEGNVEPPLVIPDSAPLITGERAVVYVRTAGEEGVYEGREITLGPRAGDLYVVREGLREGEQIVVNGAFKIDSELQIRAKKSMMYHDPGTDGQAQKDSGPVSVDAGFRASFTKVAEAYFAIQKALSEDQTAPQQVTALSDALTTIETGSLNAKALTLWQRQAPILAENLVNLGRAQDIKPARTAFEPVSEAFTALIRTFGPGEMPIYRFHCPMAFDDRGADWLQDNDQLANPYFGSAMYRCGSLKETIEPRTAHGEAGHHHE